MRIFVVGHFVRLSAAKKNLNSHHATDRNCQNEPTTGRTFMRHLNRLTRLGFLRFERFLQYDFHTGDGAGYRLTHLLRGF